MIDVLGRKIGGTVLAICGVNGVNFAVGCKGYVQLIKDFADILPCPC